MQSIPYIPSTISTNFFISLSTFDFQPRLVANFPTDWATALVGQIGPSGESGSWIELSCKSLPLLKSWSLIGPMIRALIGWLLALAAPRPCCLVHSGLILPFRLGMLLSEGRAGSAAAAGSPEEGNKHIPAQQGEDNAGWEVFITQVHPFWSNSRGIFWSCLMMAIFRFQG